MGATCRSFYEPNILNITFTSVQKKTLEASIYHVLPFSPEFIILSTKTKKLHNQQKSQIFFQMLHNTSHSPQLLESLSDLRVEVSPNLGREEKSPDLSPRDPGLHGRWGKRWKISKIFGSRCFFLRPKISWDNITEVVVRS